MNQRKKYSKEFKLDAVSLVVEPEYTRAEAARSLSISPKRLGRWVRELETQDSPAFRGNGKLTAEQLENRRLKAENRRLKMERDILKEATGIEAKETR